MTNVKSQLKETRSESVVSLTFYNHSMTALARSLKGNLAQIYTIC